MNTTIATAILDQYASANVPEGYDTIIRFFMSNVDYALETPQEAVDDELFIKCEEWCLHYGDKLGLDMPMVDAPVALKEIGVEQVRAFPEALLEIHLVEMA